MRSPFPIRTINAQRCLLDQSILGMTRKVSPDQTLRLSAAHYFLPLGERLDFLIGTLAAIPIWRRSLENKHFKRIFI